MGSSASAKPRRGDLSPGEVRRARLSPRGQPLRFPVRTGAPSPPDRRTVGGTKRFSPTSRGEGKNRSASSAPSGRAPVAVIPRGTRTPPTRPARMCVPSARGSRTCRGGAARAPIVPSRAREEPPTVFAREASLGEEGLGGPAEVRRPEPARSGGGDIVHSLRPIRHRQRPGVEFAAHRRRDRQHVHLRRRAAPRARSRTPPTTPSASLPSAARRARAALKSTLRGSRRRNRP